MIDPITPTPKGLRTALLQIPVWGDVTRADVKMPAGLYFTTLSAITAAESRIRELEEALRPFAAIEPSSGVSQDGKEDEPYQVFLAYRDRFDFTGKDLARARAAFSQEEK